MLLLQKRRLFRRQRGNWGFFSAVLIIVVGGGALASTALAAPLADSLADPLGGDAIEDGLENSSEMKAFHQLSPANQNIAWALFDSQDLEPGGASADRLMEPGWGLEDIVAARESGMNWGQVFKQMKSEGLLAGESLDQMTQSYFAEGTGQPSEEFLAAQKANSEVAAAPPAGAAGGPFGTGLQSQIVITNAAGGRVVIGLASRAPTRSAVIAPRQGGETPIGAKYVAPDVGALTLYPTGRMEGGGQADESPVRNRDLVF